MEFISVRCIENTLELFVYLVKKTNTGCTLSSAHSCKAGKGSWPASGNFLQKKCGKNIPFLDENIPYLEGVGRGYQEP